MNKGLHVISMIKNQQGVTAIVTAITMLMLIGFIALAVDVGYLYATRNELQNVADAAALAATRELGTIYQTMSYEAQQNYNVSGDRTSIVNVAKAVALKNQAANVNIDIDSADIEIGTWDGSSLTVTDEQPDAVRVRARRDSGINGPIATFFARIFTDSMSVSADATAALTGQGTAEPGELELPVGVSVTKFSGEPDSWCGKIIKFSPTTDEDACAGWTSFTEDPASNTAVKEIMEGLETSPFVYAGETLFQFINGDLSEGLFEELMKQFQNHGYDADKIYDPVAADQPDYEYPKPVGDGLKVPLCKNAEGVIVECGTEETVIANQLRYPPCSGASGCSGPLRFAHEWETTIVVYDSADCTPGKDMPIAGFAEVVVFSVGAPSDKTILARIRCDYVDPESTRGGGGNFGKKGSIPGLVE